MARLLRAIEDFEGTIVVKTALQLSPLLFQRPGEIRHMEWDEIDWEGKRWEIPGSKMKMGLDHIVPLSTQALNCLTELAAHTGRPRALLFSTGYAANVGVLGALVGKRDHVVADALNHASLIDGALETFTLITRDVDTRQHRRIEVEGVRLVTSTGSCRVRG